MMTRTKEARAELKSFMERIERLEEEKKALADDIKSVYAEAKANGFDTKALRRLIKLRKVDANDRAEQEAILETYMHAVGMALEPPLFAAVGAMSVDIAARDQVVEAFKQLVPQSGEVIVKMGGGAVRLFRDADGRAQAEDYKEEPAEPKERVGKSLGKPATVLSMVPKPKGSSPEEIKRVADGADMETDPKREGAHSEELEPAPA